MKGILKLNKIKGLSFKQCISHKQALNTEEIGQKKSRPHQLNLNVTDGVFIKHMTVLWQVTTMKTASTSTI